MLAVIDFMKYLSVECNWINIEYTRIDASPAKWQEKLLQFDIRAGPTLGPEFSRLWYQRIITTTFQSTISSPKGAQNFPEQRLFSLRISNHSSNDKMEGLPLSPSEKVDRRHDYHLKS